MTVEPGEPLVQVLARNHIPPDAVIVRKNGLVVDDWLGRIEPGCDYEIEMVRAYHLPDFLSLLRLSNVGPENKSPQKEHGSYYTRRVFWRNEAGDFDLLQSSLDEGEFADHLEKVFLDGIVGKELISEGDEIVLALSGGRDSVALGHLLSRVKGKLPDFDMHAVHVGAFSKPSDSQIAWEVAEEHDLGYTYVSAEKVAETFNLKVSPSEAVEAIKENYSRGHPIYFAHVIMRASVEQASREIGRSKLAYGLMCEDIMAAILKGLFVGFPFSNPFKREYGDFELVYPLWPITKKELTLYLETTTSSHHTQGSPSRFERGALTRDIYFHMADALEAIFPGAAMYLLQAHERAVNHFIKKSEYSTCDNCGSTYATSYVSQDPESLNLHEGLCDACSLLTELNLVS